MSWYQITWASLLRSAKAGRLSDCRVGSLYSALADADAVIEAVRRYRHACTEGDMAAIQEDVGERPGRSSESWFGEAEEAEQAMFDALERLDMANERGYDRR